MTPFQLAFGQLMRGSLLTVCMNAPAPSYESRLNALKKNAYESPLNETRFCCSVFSVPGNASPSSQTLVKTTGLPAASNSTRCSASWTVE